MIFPNAFARLRGPVRRRGDVRKTRKNHVFLQVFRIAALTRTLQKSSAKRAERASRASRATECARHTYLSGFMTPKWPPMVLRDAFGGLPGRLWDPPGRQLRPLGAPLGALGRLLGRSWALLARVWRRLLPRIFETSSPGPAFGRFGSHFGAQNCPNTPKTSEIMPLSCRKPVPQRRAPNVGFPNEDAAVARSEC